MPPETHESGIAAAYVDGGVIQVNPSPVGGTWAWAFVNAVGDKLISDAGLVLPPFGGLDYISNNLTEMMAAVQALEALPKGWHGAFYSDSQITLGRLFQGWKWRGIPQELRDRARLALDRLKINGALQVKYELLKGHPTKAELAAGRSGRMGVSKWNVYCDAECGRVGAEYMQRRVSA